MLETRIALFSTKVRVHVCHTHVALVPRELGVSRSIHMRIRKVSNIKFYRRFFAQSKVFANKHTWILRRSIFFVHARITKIQGTYKCAIWSHKHVARPVYARNTKLQGTYKCAFGRHKHVARPVHARSTKLEGTYKCALGRHKHVASYRPVHAWLFNRRGINTSPHTRDKKCLFLTASLYMRMYTIHSKCWERNRRKFGHSRTITAKHHQVRTKIF